MKRKQAVYKGLEFIPVLFEDNSLTSPEFFQITEFPTKLTAGKNLFKLKGHPSNLKVGGILGVEVLDYNGDPIYHEVINFIDDDKSRVIAIYIYEETPPGDCTVTLVAEASVINGLPVPIDQQGKINVRWKRSIPVNPSNANTSEIIFETAPNVIVSEQVGVQLNRTYPNNEQFPTYSTGTIRYFSTNNQPVIEIQNGKLEPEMKGGTLTVSSPINPTPTPTFTLPTSEYKTTIKKILSTGSALLDTEYTLFSSQSISSHTFNAFDHSTFTIDYEATPVYTATENSQSFALIEIKQLEPATGDVSRLKVFTSNKGTPDIFKLVNDFELEETEIFIESTSSLFPDETIGLFTSQSLIDFWQTDTIVNGASTGTPPQLIFNTSSLANGTDIISSTDISAENDVHIVRVKDQYNGTFVKNSEYKITFDALGIRSSTSSNQNPKLLIYMSGSSFNSNTTDVLNQVLPIDIGKKIGEIEVDTNKRRYDDQKFSFEADRSGKGVLYFIIQSGEWKLADIHVVSDNDSGYTPNFTRIKTPIETTHKVGNQVSFKLEYYNVDGVRSKQVSFVNNLDWEGGNRYIDGDFSMITGSLYVADSLNSGVAISGKPNAGFIRSLDYQGFDSGFPGFLMWSGSALTGQTSKGNPYNGVGLELYNNTESYFRYSTSDNEIDIRAKTFFLGDANSTFISGSNGLLEISSSNFHLTPEGSITGSSAIFSSPNGTVMFDTNNEFVDAINVGRILHVDNSEITLNAANFDGGSANAVTASVFSGYILPGETAVQLSYMYDATGISGGGSSIIWNHYILTASLGTTAGAGHYDNWSDVASLSQKTLTSGNTGTFNTKLVGGDQIKDRQGMYFQIYSTIYKGGTSTGNLKLKNLVYRSSRILGDSIVPPSEPK